MKRSRVVVVVGVVAVLGTAAGCGDKDHYPPGEGGGPGGGGGTGRNDAAADEPDSGVPDASLGDGGALLAGELCSPADVRDPLRTCSNADLSGIDVVAIGTGASAETDSDGRFTLAVGFEADLALAVGGGDADTRDAIVPAGLWDGGGVRAPLVRQEDWDALLAGLGAGESDGSASIAVYVQDDEESPIPDATIVSEPAATETFYDDNSLLGWGTDLVTGEFGAALLLSVQAVSEAEVVVTIGADDFRLIVPVAADHLTWARITIQTP